MILYYIKSKGQYLDQFDGKRYIWTSDRKTAWTFNQENGRRRLNLVRISTPDAEMVPVKRQR